MNSSIIRIEQGDEGTFGALLLKGKCFCSTLELPWLNNTPYTSCIPDGKYICTLFNSPKHGLVWQINDVPGRTVIEIHSANWIHQLQGCIAVGQYFDKLRINPALRAVTNSGATFDKFMQITRNETTLSLNIDTYPRKKIKRMPNSL